MVLSAKGYLCRAMTICAFSRAATEHHQSIRVLIDMHNEHHRWITVGGSTNIIEARWQALMDGIEYRLMLA